MNDQTTLTRRRHAVLRDALVTHASSPARRTRRPFAIAAAALALLGSGTALAVNGGLDFLAEQARVDQRQPWDSPDLPAGPRAELVRGPDWSLMAWRGQDGRWCLGWAAGTVETWARGCGAGASEHLVTAVLGSFAAEDGRSPVAGLVTRDVHRVEIETANLGVLRMTTEASPALGDDLRYFFTRVPAAEYNAGTSPRRLPVLAVRLFAQDGRLLDADALG